MAKNMKKRIVIKIGSSSITTDGALNMKVINSVAYQVSLIYKLGLEIVIVSSGAVACGKNKLQLKKNVSSSQIAAIYGQNHLISAWSKAFEKFNVNVGQVLISEKDLKNRSTPIIRGLRHGIQIINANDAVNDEEMKAFFLSSDNDKLAGHIAQFIGANTLILLTDVEGVLDVSRKVIREFGRKNQAGLFGKSKVGTGGIESKINVGLKSTRKGIETFIANAHKKDVILKILAGTKIGTKFL